MPASPMASAATAITATTASALESRGPRVLVVDDDEHVRLMLMTALRDEGFDARDAAHGAEAMACVQAWRPDVILLDLVMPWMNGYEFAQAYRQHAGPHAPIIVVTAAGTGAKRSALEVGADQVVHKPFQLDELLRLVGYYARYRNL